VPESPGVQKPEPRPLVEGEDFYREGPYVVFTAAYHLRRGSCCGSGCRHCPWRGSGRTGSCEAVSGGAVSGGTVSGEAVSGEAVSGEAVSDGGTASYSLGLKRLNSLPEESEKVG
jgi:hypothetical protein